MRQLAPTLAVALGGATGTLARYGLTVALPTSSAGFPWATFVANVLGCAAIGALMVLILDIWAGHRLLRPFLGVGVLGGFTTFSTYAVDVIGLLRQDRPALALAYLLGTAAAALTAVWLGARTTRLLVRSNRRPS